MPAERHPSLRRAILARGLAALFLAGIAGAVATGGEVRRIIQKHRSFSEKEITVKVGDVVQFDNEDEFIHQIYVESSNFNFDSAESSPGDSIPIKFTKPGAFAVHCHIHPKMEMIVTVQ